MQLRVPLEHLAKLVGRIAGGLIVLAALALTLPGMSFAQSGGPVAVHSRSTGVAETTIPVTSGTPT